MIFFVSMSGAVAERRVRAVGYCAIALACVPIVCILVLKTCFHVQLKILTQRSYFVNIVAGISLS
jgi:hypothetical protein